MWEAFSKYNYNFRIANYNYKASDWMFLKPSVPEKAKNDHEPLEFIVDSRGTVMFPSLLGLSLLWHLQFLISYHCHPPKARALNRVTYFSNVKIKSVVYAWCLDCEIDNLVECCYILGGH